MDALLILIPISLGIVAVAMLAFFKMSDGGQFDDMRGPALRLLEDDDKVHAPDQDAGNDAQQR